ncbi:MAG: hypothetical protein K5660_01510 [Paludibacteraceae bacterium]|nr:hypothetical protein [Paludibacteraceae bacterium]
MYQRVLILLSVVFCLAGCQQFQRRHSAGIVAEVEGQTLTEDELERVTNGLDAEDSARVAEQYIQDWALQILQYEQASKEGSERIEHLVEDYRRMLYREAYEQMLVQKYMPKQVEDSIVERYYNDHQPQFVLRENIVKGILIVLPAGTPKQDKLRKWLANPADNLEDIEKYAYKYATGYELFLDTWKTSNQLLLRLPVDDKELLGELKHKQLIEVGDSAQVYILQVADKHLEGDIMPLDYAEPDIKNILLKEREIMFLQQQRRRLYEDAVRKNKIQIR